MPRLLKRKPDPPVPHRGTFVGRYRELKEFRASVRYVMQQETPPGYTPLFPHIFLLHGESGMGKTSLLRQCMYIAHEEGIPTRRCITVYLNDISYPTPESLAEKIVQEIRIHQPKFGRHYREARNRRDTLLPRYREIQHQWQRWETLRSSTPDALHQLLHSHSYTGTHTTLRANSGKLYEPAHLEMQEAWATDELAALLAFRMTCGHIPHSFPELVQCEFGTDAPLFLQDSGLGQALAEDLYELAEHAPLILACDSYEHADHHDEWFRATVLTNTSDRMLTILASHSDIHSDYRRTFSGDYASLVCSYHLDQLLPDDVYDYLMLRLPSNTVRSDQHPAHQPRTALHLAPEVYRLSQGIPIALEAIGSHLRENNDMGPYDGMDLDRLHRRAAVYAVTERLLHYALDDKRDVPRIRERKLRDRQHIRLLALLVNPDDDQVSAMWGVSSKQAHKIVAALTTLYPFVFTGYERYDMHEQVREYIREDMRNDDNESHDWPAVTEGLQRCRRTIEERLARSEHTCRYPDQRYASAEWRADTLTLINLLLWLNDLDTAHHIFLNRWIEARYLNYAYAAELAYLATELAPATPEWRRIVQAAQHSDLVMLDTFVATLEPHAQVIYYYLLAYQPDTTSGNNPEKQLTRHISLLEQSYARDETWPPALESLAEAYADRGRCRFTAQDFKGSLQDYDHSLSLRPDHHAVLTNRGATKHVLGDDTGALQDYNRSLAMHPDHPTTLTNRGVVHYYLGNYAEALADYDHSLRLRPDHPITLYNRGVVKQAMNNLNGAQADFDHALALRPDDPDTLNSRGVVKEHLGAYYEALEDIDAALRLRPDDPDTLYNRGVVKQRLGDYRGALADFDRALAFRPYDPAALDNRGVARLHLGDFEGALKDYDRSLVLRPDHPVTLENRGVAKAYLGNYASALKDYQLALNLKPNDPSPMYNIACLYALQHQDEAALEWLERAIAQDDIWRERARTDSDFASLHTNTTFIQLVGRNDA